MNKLSILVIAVFFIFIVNVMAVPIEKSCTDSDNGSNIWTAGIATDAKGANADDCDGASENLKEFSCDGNKVKVENIKCSDYNAVCVTVGDKTVADHCGCDTGYAFSDSLQKCVYIGIHDGGSTGGPKGVPEFSLLTAGMAVVVVTAGLVFMRKN